MKTPSINIKQMNMSFIEGGFKGLKPSKFMSLEISNPDRSMAGALSSEKMTIEKPWGLRPSSELLATPPIMEQLKDAGKIACKNLSSKCSSLGQTAATPLKDVLREIGGMAMFAAKKFFG